MTLHILTDLEQGTPEWHDARRGIITASAVGKLITERTLSGIDFHCPACNAVAGGACRGKRAPHEPIKALHPERVEYAATEAPKVPPIYEVADNETSRGIISTLVAERITGVTEDTPMAFDMYRGVMCEPYARDLYSEHHEPVAEVGFMRYEGDGWTLGYSPDGLVGGDGLIEVKSPRAKTHLNTIMADEVPAYYMAQCQAGLLVSGRNWLDFVSFCQDMPLYVKRVHPDPAWFAAIEAACRSFEERAAALIYAYKKRVIGLPIADRIDLNNELGLVF